MKVSKPDKSSVARRLVESPPWRTTKSALALADHQRSPGAGDRRFQVLRGNRFRATMKSPARTASCWINLSRVVQQVRLGVLQAENRAAKKTSTVLLTLSGSDPRRRRKTSRHPPGGHHARRSSFRPWTTGYPRAGAIPNDRRGGCVSSVNNETRIRTAAFARGGCVFS